MRTFEIEKLDDIKDFAHQVKEETALIVQKQCLEEHKRVFKTVLTSKDLKRTLEVAIKAIQESIEELRDVENECMLKINLPSLRKDIDNELENNKCDKHKRKDDFEKIKKLVDDRDVVVSDFIEAMLKSMSKKS